MKTLATLFLLAASLLLRAADTPADSCNHQLYYTSPAAIWEETLPLGNGRLGMMPDGGILREHIVLNEISLWSGMEADYSNPDASKSLPAIRQLLFEGKNREAQELMYSSFVPKKQETDGRYGTYQVLGDLDIDFTYNSSLSILNSPLNNYRRWLNLRDAVAYTAFRLEDVDYHREYFVSRDRDVMLIHLVAGREGALNFSARLSRAEHSSVTVQGNTLLMDGMLESGKPGLDGMKYRVAMQLVQNGGESSVSPENALTGHENEVVSAQTDTVTDTAALVTVVALVTLHTDALHATRDEPVAFVLPGTAFRVSAGVAAEMTERGLARMQ